MIVITKDKLSIGMIVVINPQSDKTRKALLEGEIAEILTSTNEHPHGILVKLKDGAIGRVKSLGSATTGTQVIANDSLDVSAELGIEDMISNDESYHLEFKKSALWSRDYTNEQIQNSKSRHIKRFKTRTSKVLIARAIASFLNSDGGTLIIGVLENKQHGKNEVVGIDSEIKKAPDANLDGYRRMIVEDIVKVYFPANIFHHFNEYISMRFEKLNGKTLCVIKANKASKQVFLKIENKEIFFVRIDSTTKELEGKDLADYCLNHFQ